MPRKPAAKVSKRNETKVRRQATPTVEAPPEDPGVETARAARERELIGQWPLLRDLALLQGRMALRAARMSERHWHEGARLLEALNRALMDPAGLDPDCVAILASSADRINNATTGKLRGHIPKWGDDAPIAEGLRDSLAFLLERAGSPEKLGGLLGEFAQREPTAEDLGGLLEMFARGSNADRVLPRVGTSEERMVRYAKTIARVREEHPSSVPRDLAERIVIACSKAYGVHRPSRFFDAESKRAKREARKPA